MSNKTQPLRLTLQGEQDEAISRLIDLYRAQKIGKNQYILDLLKCAQIVKEAGLLDIVSSLDEQPAYRAGNQTQRRALLLAELVALAGGAPTPSPAPAPEQKPEKVSPTPADDSTTVKPSAKLPTFGR